MTQPARSTARRLTRRFAEIVAECSYASRRSVELNTPWLTRRHTTNAVSR
jgi:hypothetical protein